MFHDINDYEIIYTDLDPYKNYKAWIGWIEVPGHNNYYMTYDSLPRLGWSAERVVIVKTNKAKQTSLNITDIDINRYDTKRASEIIKSYKFKKALEQL